MTRKIKDPEPPEGEKRPTAATGHNTRAWLKLNPPPSAVDPGKEALRTKVQYSGPLGHVGSYAEVVGVPNL